MEDKTIIGHNLKFDFAVLLRYEMALPKQYFDTMIAAYILDAGENSFSLETCATREMNYKMMPIKELIGTGKNQSTFDHHQPGRGMLLCRRGCLGLAAPLSDL